MQWCEIELRTRIDPTKEEIRLQQVISDVGKEADLLWQIRNGKIGVFSSHWIPTPITFGHVSKEVVWNLDSNLNF